MLQYNLTFILVHISTVCTFILLFLILKYRKKVQMHYVFLALTLLLTIWNISTLFENYIRRLFNYTEIIFVNINYISICLIPVCIYFLGLTYAETKITFTWKHMLLFVIPIITTVIIWTNHSHHLFFINFSVYSREAVYGIYYYFHSLYSYTLIGIGMYYLFSSSLRNSGFFSKQSNLILIGIIVPLAVNIIYSFNLAPLTFDINSVVFTFASACFAIAILKFQFLNIAPIALQQVMDRISDSFVVTNEEGVIIDFNLTMQNVFKDVLSIKRNEEFFRVLGQSEYFSPESLHKWKKNFNTMKNLQNPVIFEDHIKGENFDKYFNIEITPIISKKNYLGNIILFKDITENIRYINTIQEKHTIMMEQERLASLGQLIGGIAHNLKTPIMSIAGAVEALKDLTDEYEQSIGDSSVTDQDHHEIADEMHSWLKKISPYCSYMTDIIDTVKGQAMQFNTSSMVGFTVKELLKRIELLMKYELIRYNCTLNTVNNAGSNIEIYGDINSLVQVFDNIIMNAIHAYEKRHGVIDFIIEENEDSILFTIRDYAKGIPEGIKNKLLKEMITTKGKDGTGLGLYLSASTIKGKFEGKIWFESEEGKGTTFYIQIPLKNINNRQMANK
jgi:signal transduction histidine kinase